MNKLSVPCQTLHTFEAFITRRTGEWSLSGMHPDVQAQPVTALETGIALSTLEWALNTVHLENTLQYQSVYVWSLFYMLAHITRTSE